MTTEEKNIEIAKMLGWKYWPKVSFPKGFVKMYTDAWESPNRKVAVSSKGLRYHEDGNWQLSALEWIEEQLMFEDKLYYTQITKKHCNIRSEERTIDKYRTKEGFKSWEYFCNVSVTADSKKEAIFEALYQFSQYIKEKK